MTSTALVTPALPPLPEMEGMCLSTGRQDIFYQVYESILEIQRLSMAAPTAENAWVVAEGVFNTFDYASRMFQPHAALINEVPEILACFQELCKISDLQVVEFCRITTNRKLGRLTYRQAIEYSNFMLACMPAVCAIHQLIRGHHFKHYSPKRLAQLKRDADHHLRLCLSTISANWHPSTTEYLQ